MTPPDATLSHTSVAVTLSLVVLANTSKIQSNTTPMVKV